MKKRLFLIIAAVGLTSAAWAQQNSLAPVQSIWEVAGANLELNYNNSDYCEYYLVSSRNKEIRVSRGKNNLLRIPREQAAKYRNDPAFMPASFRTFKGYFPEKLNPDFLYTLPVRTGDSIRYRVG